MKKLSESVGLLIGIFGIAGVAATVAYFAWDQRNLGATNSSLIKENSFYQTTIKDLEGAIARLESEIDANKIAGSETESPENEDNEPRTQNSRKELPVPVAGNSAQLAQVAPSTEAERGKSIKSKGAFRFESVGCRVANGNTQCSIIISNITELERSLGIRASDAAMTDINGDSYRASSAQFRGMSTNYMRFPMTTSSNDKATWTFEDVAAGAVPAKLSFTVSDEYKENNIMQNREIYEELEIPSSK